MAQTIIINDMAINASELRVESINTNEQPRTKVAFNFKVTHDMYHDVTTLLYENDFIVKVPERSLEFPAVISRYSTSVTNLYEPGTVGDFSLELTEKKT